MGADRIAALRGGLERALIAVSPEAKVLGQAIDRLPNTSLFAVPGLAAETVVIAFDLQGIAVSAGSACSSGKVSASHVLEAMGEPPDTARGGIRVSLTADATEADVESFIVAWRAIHKRLAGSRAA